MSKQKLPVRAATEVARSGSYGADETGVREDVPDDVVLSRVVGVAGGDPAVPGLTEEVHECGVVHREQRLVLVRVGIDHGGAGLLQRPPDQIGSLRQLVGGMRQADPHLAARPVQPVRLRPDDGHAQRHDGEPTALRCG